jgi:hypothetical protein
VKSKGVFFLLTALALMALLVPPKRVRPVDTSRRIGVATGKYRLPENFDEPDDDIVALFAGVDS